MSDEVLNLTDEQTDALRHGVFATAEAIAGALGKLINRGVSPHEPEIFTAAPMEAGTALDLPVCSVAASYAPVFNGSEYFIFNQTDVNVLLDLGQGLGLTEISEDTPFDAARTKSAGDMLSAVIDAAAAALSQVTGSNIKPVNQPVFLGSGIDALDALTVDEVVVIYSDVTVDGFEPFRFARVMPSALAANIARAVYAKTAPESVQPASPEPAADSKPASASDRPSPAVTTQPAVPASSPQAAQEVKQVVKQEVKVEEPAKISPVTFSSFDSADDSSDLQKQMRIVKNVPLQVAVELGRAVFPLSEIMNFEIGSYIVLDKQAGDPADIYVNKKMVARGEVFVLGDNLAIRVTEIDNHRTV